MILDIADQDGVGFNDPTPATPVGGNMGTTVGEQRRIAFQHALDIWGDALDSPVPIHVEASFGPLECTASSAVLGQAGPGGFEFYVPGQDPNILFPEALADRLVGYDLAPGIPDIQAEFNGSLTDCFPGLDWYYGTDAQAFDDKADLVMTVLHEIGHGLGFLSTVDNETGRLISDGSPDPFTMQLLDTTTGKRWDAMTDSERLASASSIRGLVWAGTHGNAAAATWLTAGAPRIRTTPTVPGLNDALIDANFGRKLSEGAIMGTAVAPTPADGCDYQTGVSGFIAVLPPANCHPLNQLAFAEEAGAIAGIVVADEAPPPALDQSPEDLAIISTTLPTVGMTQTDADLLLAASGVTVELYADMTRRTGTDGEGRVYIFASDPVTTSSASHIEPVVRPDAVLEPSQTANIHHDVTLERAMLRDIGWETSCGNGTIDVGETCDNGSANSDTTPDACRENCVTASCGDDVVDTGEQCDDTSMDSACNDDCTLPVCGDGVVGPGEECDDGSGNSDSAANACRTSCEEASCGDGVVDSGEACDDALTPATCQSCIVLSGTGGSGGAGGGAGAGGSGGGVSAGGSAGAGAAPAGGAAGSRTSPPDDADLAKEESGCGCRVPAKPSDHGPYWTGLLALLVLSRRRVTRSPDGGGV
jgi:MYXO-CTERM domain-containing protein